MKYLVKPFRFLLGIFLFLINCIIYIISFIALFLWDLNPKIVYYKLRREFKYRWICTWEDLGWVVKDDIDIYIYIKYQRKYYKTLLDFMNNKITYVE